MARRDHRFRRRGEFAQKGQNRLIVHRFEVIHNQQRPLARQGVADDFVLILFAGAGDVFALQADRQRVVNVVERPQNLPPRADAFRRQNRQFRARPDNRLEAVFRRQIVEISQKAMADFQRQRAFADAADAVNRDERVLRRRIRAQNRRDFLQFGLAPDEIAVIRLRQVVIDFRAFRQHERAAGQGFLFNQLFRQLQERVAHAGVQAGQRLQLDALHLGLLAQGFRRHALKLKAVNRLQFGQMADFFREAAQEKRHGLIHALAVFARRQHGIERLRDNRPLISQIRTRIFEDFQERGLRVLVFEKFRRVAQRGRQLLVLRLVFLEESPRRTLEIALPLLNDGRELKFFVLPNEHDPDSLIRREGLENFQKLLQQAPLLSDFVFAHLTGQHDVSSPEGKSLVMGELRELTELLPKYGSFRYLLTQSFREKLGLGKRFTPQISHDASLSFNIHTKDEDFAIAILMHHPFLYIHFEELRAVIDHTELLAKILASLNIVFDDLPDDQELATYYVLGACSNYSHEIADIMQRTDIQSLTQAPEIADKLAKEYALGLQEKYLRIKLKSPISLIESRNLRQQLNELTKQIGLRLLS